MALLAVAASACSDGLEFADWTIPVPPETPVIEYPAVPLEERGGRITFVEELRLGTNDADPTQAFYQPRDVDADTDGNIYVLDAGNHCVKVYDAAGRHLRTLGREGQGPGELERPRSITVAGDRLVARDLSEMSVWTLDGTHISDTRHLVRFGEVVGLTDGTLVANHVADVGMSDPWLAVSSFDLDGAFNTTYVELPLKPGEWPAPEFAASRDGMVYVTATREYQVLAMAQDGQARWALRIAWPRPSPDEIADLDHVRVELPEDRMLALTHLAVDGHGHLYVYPYDTAEGASPLLPVDVYTPDGERIFSGMIDDMRWVKARGDHVYVPIFDIGTGEHHVVRYRLVEPF